MMLPLTVAVPAATSLDPPCPVFESSFKLLMPAAVLLAASQFPHWHWLASFETLKCAVYSSSTTRFSGSSAKPPPAADVLLARKDSSYAAAGLLGLRQDQQQILLKECAAGMNPYTLYDLHLLAASSVSQLSMSAASACSAYEPFDIPTSRYGP